AWPSFGGDGYWCFQNRETKFIPLALLYADILILMTSLFCYIGIVHDINVSRFRNDQENFCTANKKIVGYLFTYILQWTPVMIYIIADIEQQANMWVFSICITSLPIGGILKTNQWQELSEELSNDNRSHQIISEDQDHSQDKIQPQSLSGKNDLKHN
ncbi:10513_t:CDS:2, partial [Funneliformis geosporum]